MSAETPSWWENPDFIDEEQLRAEPDYPDKMAGRIDDWLNHIVPAENIASDTPFVMKDSFNVIVREELQGIPTGTAGTIIVKDDFKAITVDFVFPDGKTVTMKLSLIFCCRGDLTTF